ncbi:MAG TPA: hypothetical protein VKY74_00400 [Chloroflexia bacterium]|nr:hypothetical protein [Chloroflexia bacterium]
MAAQPPRTYTAEEYLALESTLGLAAIYANVEFPAPAAGPPV